MRLSEAVAASPRIEIHVLGARGAPSTVPGPAGDVAKVNDRAALAAIAAPAAKSARWMAEAGRNGLFEFDGSDLSAEVTADTAQGIYVAPAGAPTGATGAWVRQFDGPINPMWFGVVHGDAAGANGAGNSVAISAMFALLRVRSRYEDFVYRGLEPIRLPIGYFEISSTIEITDGAGIFEGCDPGFSQTRATIIKAPSGVTAIRVQRYNTSGASAEDDPTHFAGDGFTIRNIALLGSYTTAGGEMEAHGIHLRARANLENVNIEEFEGDGVHGNATAGGAPEGNANASKLYNVRSRRNRNGIYIDGADANIWTIIGSDTADNRQWGIWDSSFLGNSIFGAHASTNGVTVGAVTSMVSHGGQRYVVKVGQAVGASTNAPSGTTASNTWWVHVGAGGPLTVSANIPAWVSGITVREGGSYCTDNGNAQTLFSGCYHEGGYGVPQLATRTMVLGGFASLSTSGGSGAAVNSINGFVRTYNGFQVESYDKAASTFTVQLGAGASRVALSITDSVMHPSGWALRFINSDRDLSFNYAGSGSQTAFTITGLNTLQQFGKGAAFPYGTYVPSLLVGDSITNARQITNGTVAPTTGAHAVGEVVFNRTPAAGAPIGWVCTAAGTPGTWLAFPFDPAVQTSGFNTVTPTFNDDVVERFGASAAITLANPTGTAKNGKRIAIRLRDNGSARTISYGTNYRAVGVTLPATTVVNKLTYLEMIYNSTDTKWDVVLVAQEA